MRDYLHPSCSPPPLPPHHTLFLQHKNFTKPYTSGTARQFACKFSLI